jgi:hypothetical protein
VDWTGRFLLLALSPGADPVAVTEAALGLLAPRAGRLTPEAAAEQVAGFRRGERWMRTGETMLMSREEARVLSRRFAETAAREEGLSEDETARVMAALDEAISEAARRIHESGEPPRVDPARLPELLAPVAARCREFLTEERATRVAKALLRAFRQAIGQRGS